MKRFADPEVAAVFAGYPPAARKKLLALRALIFATAAKTKGVGPLEESLRWGEPAYLTLESKSGSTIRIDWKPKRPDEVAMYFHCRTGLVGTFRRLHPKLRFEGNRALVLGVAERVPSAALARCIALALNHRRRY
jgi:hypothetical protein